ncbi:MAG TPA: oxygen-dependent coproporphyrinogen oxidase [Luteibaculaceae bacterium]|nr:oxygen-dependent coproporphyrinogen oxidase [Luteibaculaceae bacterium]
MRSLISESFRAIQNEICSGLEAADGGAKFTSDTWERPGGGGGDSRVIQNGNLLEKGGVNFSEVFGELPPIVAKEFAVTSTSFFATGVSLVLHPYSPKVPIVHMNIRYFEVPGDGLAWFGGGIDLTPIYLDREDAKNFHTVLKTTCDKHHADYYQRFKKWADDYFFIKHRGETRGIGGIFFDRLSDGKDLPLNEQFSFVRDVGKAFLPAYLPIAEKHRNESFSEQEKQWQLIRRGRYVEFNLVYDRGTHFGLHTSGRIESILMSLPQFASWQYNHQPTPGSPEWDTIEALKTTHHWVD